MTRSNIVGWPNIWSTSEEEVENENHDPKVPGLAQGRLFQLLHLRQIDSSLVCGKQMNNFCQCPFVSSFNSISYNPNRVL